MPKTGHAGATKKAISANMGEISEYNGRNSAISAAKIAENTHCRDWTRRGVKQVKSSK